MRSCFLAASLMLLGVPRPARAQTSLQSVIGSRVRVTTRDPSPGRVVGRAVAVARDTLVVVAGPRLVRFPLSSVARIEVQSRKRKVPVIIGAGVGAIGGAAIGVMLAGTECLRGPVIDPCDATTELGAPLAGAVIGAVVGGALGSLLQGGRWQDLTVSLGSRTTVGVRLRLPGRRLVN